MLLIFFKINLDSNIVILLGIIIILLINDLIKRSEHFTSVSPNVLIKSNVNIGKQQANQMAKFDIILNMMKMIQNNKKNDVIEEKMKQNYKDIIVNSSCVRNYEDDSSLSSISMDYNLNIDENLKDKIGPISAVLSKIPN